MKFLLLALALSAIATQAIPPPNEEFDAVAPEQEFDDDYEKSAKLPPLSSSMQLLVENSKLDTPKCKKWAIKFEGGCKEYAGPNGKWDNGKGDDLYMSHTSPWAGDPKMTAAECQALCTSTAGCAAAVYGNPAGHGEAGKPYMMFQGCCQLYKAGCTNDDDAVNEATWDHYECAAAPAPAPPPAPPVRPCTCDCHLNPHHPIHHATKNFLIYCEAQWGTTSAATNCPAEPANPWTGAGGTYAQSCGADTSGHHGCCNRQCCDGTGPHGPSQ